MKGIWLEGGQLRLRHGIPAPEPPPGEALVRVLAAGICNTDVELARGYYPYAGVLGHEFVGVVASDGALRGQRVVGEINAVCGDCRACRAGRRTHCERRTVLGIVKRNGAFAEYLTLPVDNLHVVPDAVATEAAVFTEPLAAALQIQEQVEIGPDTNVLVVGDGKLGQLVAQTLALSGCRLQVVGRYGPKLERLTRRGIRAVAADAVPAGEFDVAVECTGNHLGFGVAQRALRPRGTLVMKSTYADRLTLDASAVVVNELTLVGSRCGPFPKALTLLAAGTVDVLSLVAARYPLERALDAFDHAQRPGTLKVLFDVGFSEAVRPTEPSGPAVPAPRR
jgi:threonine dehydrogenase-like Zn-dependent dehydrogenase